MVGPPSECWNPFQCSDGGFFYGRNRTNMKITFRLIVSLLFGTALVVLLFSYVQTQAEEKKLNEDLGLRARLITKSFKEAIEPFLDITAHQFPDERFLVRLIALA